MEAAHVRWHCYDGPDELANGLALCSLHHKALDRGALGLTEDGRVQISSDLHGSEMVELLLLRYTGQPLRLPQPGLERPALGSCMDDAEGVEEGKDGIDDQQEMAFSDRNPYPGWIASAFVISAALITLGMSR